MNFITINKKIFYLIMICFFIGYNNILAQDEEIFKVDINKKKEKIERSCNDVEKYLLENNFRNARSALDLADYELRQVRNRLTKNDAIEFKKKIEDLTVKFNSKEDSVVQHALKILRTQGVEQALQYVQIDLRKYGVSEKKVSIVENQIITEAPALKHAQEREAIAKTVKALESGLPIDPNTDPYIIKTAQRIIKAKEDSILAIQKEQKRKELEEKQKQERKIIEQQIKEREKEEKRQAKLKKEEEKKKKEEEKAEQKRLATLRKEEEKRKAEEEKKAQKIAFTQKQIEENKIKEEQKQMKSQEKPIITETGVEDTETTISRPKITVKDSSYKEVIISSEKKEISDKEQIIKPKETKKVTEHQSFKPQVVSLAKDTFPKEVAIYQPQEELKPESKVSEQSRDIYPVSSKYLAELKENQKKAQEYVMEMYELLENNQPNKAIEIFKENRKFISQFVDAQVYTTLEKSIAEAVINASTKQNLINQEISTAPKAVTKTFVETEYIERINNYIKENKIEEAYSEFNRVKKIIKNYMTKDEFKRLKEMIENAYKIRKGIK
jgi:hypothetical protein